MRLTNNVWQYYYHFGIQIRGMSKSLLKTVFLGLVAGSSPQTPGVFNMNAQRILSIEFAVL